MNETTDQSIKDIIFKYIVKPDMEKKGKSKSEVAVVNKSVCAEMDKSLQQGERFVQDYVEIHTKFLIQQQKAIVEEQIEKQR